MCIEITRVDRLLVSRIPYDDPRQPVFQILERSGKAENRHNLGCDDDIKTVFARISICRSPQGDGDLPKGAIVHIDHAFPGDAPHVEVKFISMVNMIVDHRRKKIMGKTDCAEVASEMEIDILHWYNLRVAATRGPAFHAEYGPKRWLAQTNRCFLADPVQRIAKSNRRCGLAFPSRGGTDCSDENEFAIWPVCETVNVTQRNLGF